MHRPEDGEHVGYLSPEGAPHLLTGSALPTPSGDARDLLTRRGLAALDGRWWCRLPSPLPRVVLDASRPQPEWEWQAVVIVEATPETTTVRPEWPAPEESTSRAVLPTPVGDLLRDEPG